MTNFRLSSRILLPLAAAFLLTPFLGAQTRSYGDADQVRKAVSKASSWIKLSRAYEDAYLFPLSNIVPGEGNSIRTLVVKGQRPREIMAETPFRAVYKNVYSDKDIYFDIDGNLIGIVVIRPVLDTVKVLDRMLEACLAARDQDGKGRYTAEIGRRVALAVREYRSLSEMSAFMQDSLSAAAYIFKAADASLIVPCDRPDTAAVYAAGLLAEQERDYPRALLYLRSARDMNYAGQTGGDLYLHLATVMRRCGEDTFDCLNEGVQAFPDNQDLAKALAGYRRALSAEEHLAEGEALYREAMDAVKAAVQLDPGDNKAYRRQQEVFTDCLRRAEEPFQDCLEMTDDPALRKQAQEYLRRIRLYFALEAR